MTPQRVSMVTLSVRDLEKSRKFYTALGFDEAKGGNEKIAFYKMGGLFFSLYDRDALVIDIGMPVHDRTTGGVSLATNYNSREEVDAAFARAQKAGATIITKPTEVHWGGYSGNYADPDGHLWEVAYNPFWSLDENGLVTGEP